MHKLSKMLYWHLLLFFVVTIVGTTLAYKLESMAIGAVMIVLWLVIVLVTALRMDFIQNYEM